MYYGPELISGLLLAWAAKQHIHIQHSNQVNHSKMRMLRDITEQYDMSGYHSIIGAASMKFKPLLTNGCINTIMNVQIWHWAVLPRNSDWPWLLN